jgi:hypothetical protein
VFVISNTPTAEGLQGQRTDVVKEELERDGIKSEVISAIRHSSFVPASLQEWQNRRILIVIQTNSAFAKVAN